MKVTIVTISFNQAEFLEEAMLSVLNQSYKNIEYIVVDPGSTDGSREIIEKYRNRIAHVIFEPDDGPADGLNNGFSKATGDIYAYLNADDILLPEVVSKMVGYFQRFSDADVISGHGEVIDADSNRLYRDFSDLFSLKSFLSGGGVVIQQSTFFNAQFYKLAGGFNAKNRNCWDGELMLDMALHGAKFKVVNAFIGGFRLHEQSISGSGRLEDDFLETQLSLKKRCINAVPELLPYIDNHTFRIFNRMRNPLACVFRLLDELISRNGRKKWKNRGL